MDHAALEEFLGEVDWLFHPEPDEDGMLPREYPSERLTDHYSLDFSYMQTSIWEGSSIHEYTRVCPVDAEGIHRLTKNQDVPSRLFQTALRLFADSVAEYHERSGGSGEIRFYPPVLLTFWAGFESFVRHSSQLMILTVRELPVEVKNFLSDEEAYVDGKGAIRIRSRFQNVLDRYAVFLKYGYGYNVDRGSTFWQALSKAKALRDYYTHLDVSDVRDISAGEVLSYMEAILLAIIIPSSHLQRTLMLGIYWLYRIWTTLYEHAPEYTERPFFMNWHLKEQYLFHCNFENVDCERFRSSSHRG